MIDAIYLSIYMVIHAPFFWGSMGLTSAIAMLIGALIYDGHVKRAQRGIISVFSYAAMMAWTNLIRVNSLLSTYPEEEIVFHSNAFNSTITLIFISLAWLFGVFLGVTIFALKNTYGNKKSYH